MILAKHNWLFLAFIVCSLSCSDKQDFPEFGISRGLADIRKEQVKNVRYSLNFDIPESSLQEIRGVLRFSADLSDLSNDLILDFEGADSLVTGVYKGEALLKYEVINDHIVILKKDLSESFNIRITFIAGEQALNRKEEFLYTLFVPANASSCFPVLDQPNVKGRYKLTLSLPKEWEAISNEHITSVVDNEDKKILEFGETPPISSYLFAFAAGLFKSVSQTMEGKEYTMLHREVDSVKVQNNVNDIFYWHHKSLLWLEEYTNIEYPFNKFGFVLLPSFQFGGMEHPGAIFYKASSLFLDESHSIDQKKSRAHLIAHETAHMWFGDLVTMEWFDDVWLKEVFANFMAAKIVQPGFPEINYDLQFLLSYYPGAYDVDRTQGTHPIQQDLKNLKDAGSLYGNIIYQKSPIVMKMLEENMGEDAFKIGLREYLKQYSFSNATWDQLVSILSEKSDYNLKSWNKQWVKSAGMPTHYYNINTRNDSITKYVVHTAPGERGKMWWPQKLKVEIGWEDSSQVFNVEKNGTSVNLPEVNGRLFPKYVFNNSGGLGYGYFDMRTGSTDHYLEQAGAISDPVKRAAIWINLHESAIRGSVNPERVVAAQIENLANEREPLIISYLLRSLQHLYWVYLEDEQRSKHVSMLEGVLLNNLINTDPSVKMSYLNALKQVASSEKSIDLLRSLFLREVQIDGLSLSDRDKVSLVYELAVRELSDADTLLENFVHEISNPDLKSRIRFVSNAVMGDSEARTAFFKSLSSLENRKNEEWVLEALSYLHHPLRRNESVKYIKPSLELLEEIKQTGDIFFPKRWLDRTLDSHQSEQALEEVQSFLYKNNRYSQDLKRKLLQASDHLFRSVEVRKAWKEQVEKKKMDPL